MNEFSEEDRFGRNISNLGLIGCRMFRCVYLSGGFRHFFFFLNILGGGECTNTSWVECTFWWVGLVGTSYFRQVAVDRILYFPYRVRTCTACMQKGTGMGATACLSGRD